MILSVNDANAIFISRCQEKYLELMATTCALQLHISRSTKNDKYFNSNAAEFLKNNPQVYISLLFPIGYEKIIGED
jgi:hypothetical protein